MVNKKGSGWPTQLLSTVFSLVLLLIGIFIMNDVIKFVDANEIKYTGTLNFYTVAARVMNSPDCAAWEESYPGQATIYQPHLGIIDISKFNNTKIQKCISGKDFLIVLSYNGREVSTEKNPNDLENARRDIFPVRVYDNEKMYDGMLKVTIK